MPSFSDILGSVATSTVKTVTIDTALQPGPVTVDLTAPSSGPPPGFFLGILKPQISIQGAAGNYVVHPWGVPQDRATFYLIFGGAIVVTGLAMIGAYTLFFAKR